MSSTVVLLTGASGLVGTWLRRSVPTGTELVALVHRAAVPGTACVAADLRDRDALAAAVERVGPAMIVHAAMALDAPSIVDATSNVVDCAAAVDADVVHLSTDAVFSGDGRPVAEHATPDPTFDYGRWKAEAEAIVTGADARSCVIRLPLVVSLTPPDRAVERIARGAGDGVPTGWFHDEFRRPAMAADITDGIWRIAALARDARAGAWHLGGPELLSRYEIARRVTNALRLDPEVIEAVASPVDVIRPRHIDLRSERARTVIGWHPSTVLP